ncbi:uncharacterized protein LOC122510700 [Leptopilina heterotoma]|uniref:uncharacterized protein LOC122510700 n=1 Tax=Leptopilina heterotoma TaxID=63436 RepID=UPI001CA9426A|nr:uncharacterized protein LOC122510700 [Leptopilina heterotoma]
MVSIKKLQIILDFLLISLKEYNDYKNNNAAHVDQETKDRIANVDEWSRAMRSFGSSFIMMLIHSKEDDFLQNIFKEVKNENRSENIQFTNDLSTVFRYSNMILKNKRNPTPKVDDFKIDESNFMKIINFMMASANYYHFYHNGFNFSLLADLRSKNEEVLKLIMSNPDRTTSENDAFLYPFLSLFWVYSLMFPTLANSENYTDCYFDALVGFRIPNDTIFNFHLEKEEKIEILLTNLTIPLKNLLSCMLLQPEIKKTVEENPILNEAFKNITIIPSDEFNEKHELFKNHLKLAIDYFKNVLKLDDCNKFPKFNNSKNDEFNFQKIVNLLTQTAMENYLLHKNYYPQSSSFPETRSEEMRKLMPSECVPGLNENKETFKRLFEFFDLLKVFSSEFFYRKKRYLKNILELLLINEKIEEFVLKKNNVSRETLNTSIKKGIKIVSDCLTPRAI